MMAITHPDSVPTTGTVRTHPRKIIPSARQLVARNCDNRERNQHEIPNCENRSSDEEEERRKTDVTVAESDSHRSSSDTHRGRNGKSVLRSENDGDSGPELHRESSRRRVRSNVVTAAKAQR